MNEHEKFGYTLLEILIVLAILITISVIVLPMLSPKIETASGVTQTPNEITTHATLQVIRDAMIGEEGVLEGLAHKPDAMPREVSELVSPDAPEHVKQVAPELTIYDPVYKTGWRGPYVHSTGKNETGKPTVVDGWGKEFKIQVDFDGNGAVDEKESQFMRVVSAGPNGQFDTPEDIDNMVPGKSTEQELTKPECGDDIVLFVRVPDFRE